MTIRVVYAGWQEAIRQIATEWNSFFNGKFRLIRGVDTIDDVIIDSNTVGLVLKDSTGVYFRVTVSTLGALVITNIGTTKP